jgi:hypothetical protein
VLLFHLEFSLFDRLEQFNDVLFQENRLVKDNSEDGKIKSPGSPLIGLSEMESISSNKALHLEPIKVGFTAFHINNHTLIFRIPFPIWLVMRIDKLQSMKHKCS